MFSLKVKLSFFSGIIVASVISFFMFRGCCMAKAENWITAQELKKTLDSKEGKVYIVDARHSGPVSRTPKKIPGAIHLSTEMDDQKIVTSLPNKDWKIIVYCHSDSCPMAPWMITKLKDLGYANIVKMGPGLQEWLSLSYETEDMT